MKFGLSYMLYQNRDFTKHDVYVKLFALLFALIPTWLIINYTRITANQITILGIILGLLGAIGGFLFSLKYLLAGFFGFYLCDYVDGNVAAARGGGTYWGTILDLFADRLILNISAFVLINYHLESNHYIELLLLVSFLMSFYLMDVTGLAFLTAKDAYNKKSKSKTEQKVYNDFKKIFSKPTIWFPTRVSSYLFIIVTYLFTESFLYSYVAGLVCIISAFTLTLINSKHLKKLIHN